MRRADNVFQTFEYAPATTTAHGVAAGLAGTYAELVDVELPDTLSSLARLLQEREATVWSTSRVAAHPPYRRSS